MIARTLSLSLLPLLLGLLAAPAAAVSLFLDPATQTTTGTFSLDVVIDGLGVGMAPTVGAFDVTIAYDASRVSFLGGSFGAGLGSPAQTVSNFNAGIGDVQAFSVSLLAPATLDALQGASVTLASLDFQATGVGPTSLDFSSVLISDAFGNQLALEAISGASVEVNPIPEPAAALVFAVGAAWIARTTSRSSRCRRIR